MIHLLSASENNLPEVEFEGSEGPDQIMDQIQNFAVPLIRKAVHPVGPRLHWEELDIERGHLRQHAYQLEDQVKFELCPDDQGIELLLPDRVWVPLRALAQPGSGQLAALGWTVSKPRFYWRYVEIGQTPRLELNWHCDEIYAGWADLVRQRFPVIQCRLGNGRSCPMNLRREGPLFYRGHFQLSGDMWLPARWRLTLRQPLVVVAGDGGANGTGDADGNAEVSNAEVSNAEANNAEVNNAGEVIDNDISVTARALDFRAVLPDRTTRLISDEDLGHRFEAEVLTPEEILLPHEITGGLIPGLPWTLAVEPAAVVVAAGPGHEEGPGPAAARHRRWILRPLDEEGGTWGEVDWKKNPTLRFVLGSAEMDAADSAAPQLARIDSRRATVGWRIESSEEEPDELLCFTIPHWVPMEGLEHQPFRDQPHGDHGFEYASEVRAWLKGLEERFVIDPSSEMSANRIFLDPRRWRFYDEAHGDLKDAEALGEVSGYVRWRRPEPDEGGERPFRGREVTPTDWAVGRAPVLLVRRTDEDSRHSYVRGSHVRHSNVRCWGGLYVPESVPWEALQEVRPERAGDHLLLIPRSTLPALWISLWGFLCRYDRHRVIFSQRAPQTLNAWIAGTGLELFPADRDGKQMESEGAGRGFLIRSFAPLYAVRDSDPRVFSLETSPEAATPRPVLRLGRELHEPEGPRSLEIGESTLVRFQITDQGQVPESFGPGRIPNTPLHLSLDPQRQTVWFALEQRSPGTAGYLLSWDRPAGWRFRGFFAHPDAAVALGQIRLGADETAQVLLGDESGAGRQTFRLTLGADGHSWGENTPEAIAQEVSPEMIDAWEQRYYARDQLPPPLSDFEMRIVRQPVDDGPRIFEFLPREDASVLDPPPGIRVWEPQEGADETFLTGTKILGIPGLEIPSEPEPPKAPAPEPSLRPRKKMLKADEDDDEDFC